MRFGNLARKALGKTAFKKLAYYYRAFFFDIGAFVDNLTDLNLAKTVLEIGGGDGAIADQILRIHPKIEIVIVDIAENIGSFINDAYKDRLKILPGCSLEKYLSSVDFVRPDVILVSDVIHHIPANQRNSFISFLIPLLEDGTTLIVKEVQPEGLRAWFSLMADKYISGDKNTSLIAKQDLIALLMDLSPLLICEESSLFKLDKPNYSFSFKVK